jgi:homoserine kinase
MISEGTVSTPPSDAPPIGVKAQVTVFAPATVANLGVGFDIFGMALDAPGDEVTVEYDERPGVELVAISGDAGRLPTDPARNTACIAAREALKAMGTDHGVRLWLNKGLPLASGLGSSAASAAAAAVAVNELYGAPLARGDLLEACIEAEAAVSGRHADNVAPALWGGIVLVTGLDTASVHRLPVPDRLYLALVTPDIALPTAVARAILPSHVALRTMVSQTGLVAAFVHALHTGDLALMARVMELDTVITPARTPLIPGLIQAQASARDAGALACIISGAGPTLCAFCDSPATAQGVTTAFCHVYDSLGIGCQTRVARPALAGAVVRAAPGSLE